MELVLALGNGIILEMRAEADSHETLDILRGLVRGTGSCEPVELDGAQRERLWLYADGDECYQQGSKNPGFIFLDPIPRPEKFAAGQANAT